MSKSTQTTDIFDGLPVPGVRKTIFKQKVQWIRLSEYSIGVIERGSGKQSLTEYAAKNNIPVYKVTNLFRCRYNILLRCFKTFLCRQGIKQCPLTLRYINENNISMDDITFYVQKHLFDKKCVRHFREFCNDNSTDGKEKNAVIISFTEILNDVQLLKNVCKMYDGTDTTIVNILAHAPGINYSEILSCLDHFITCNDEVANVVNINY